MIEEMVCPDISILYGDGYTLGYIPGRGWTDVYPVVYLYRIYRYKRNTLIHVTLQEVQARIAANAQLPGSDNMKNRQNPTV
jgi:hypothetical protein